MAGLLAFVQREFVVVAITAMPEFVQFFACAGNQAALPRQIANRTIEF